MAWQPNPEDVQQIVELMKLSQTPRPDVQQTVHQELEKLHNNPEYSRYLCYIFTKLPELGEDLRMLAGLMLKNYIRGYYVHLPEPIRTYIKNEVVQCIGDKRTAVRRTVGTIITTVIEVTSVNEFPGLLQLFIQLLDSQDVNVIDGTLSALEKIIADSSEKLDAEDHATGQPLHTLIPKLFHFFNSEHEAFRRFSLNCISQFIICMPSALMAHMRTFIEGLFHLSQDSSSEVKMLVSQSFITLVEVRLEHLQPYLENTLQCLLQLSQDPDDEVALEACEFWPSIAETRCCEEILLQFLPNILPILLERIVYSEDEIALLESEAKEDASVPDRQQDIRPYLTKNRSEEDENVDVEEWSLRKCAAAGIDIFAAEFGEDILPFVLPILQQRLDDKELWPIRESAILCLGAIAEGCSDALGPHLPKIIPFLFTQLNDTEPCIRSITCWTLSRYGNWIAEQKERTVFMEPFLQGLIGHLLDPQKKVQEAAISALATFEEIAQEKLLPYLSHILQALVSAYGKYQAKNLLILYDAIGTMADSIGSHLNKAEYINVLMPPLIERWNSLADDDIRLFPLLECLNSVAVALGEGFSNFAEPVARRCLKLIENTLVADMAAQQDPAAELPELDFIVCSLDMLGGIVEGLGSASAGLIQHTNLLSLLFACMNHASADIKQSAFALVGEMSKSCMKLLTPCLSEYLPVLANNLHPEGNAACNNSCWAVGEIAMRLGTDMKPYAEVFVKRLIPIINQPYLTRALLENAAITLGRLGLVCPDVVAPYLEEFIKSWCLSLRSVRDDNEKASAFEGLCLMIKTNPLGAVKHFAYVCDAIASWSRPKPALRELFHQILHGFRASVGDEEWNRIQEPWPAALREVLHERYGI
ncbi:Transportin-1 [Balamuthia mandrillaris]